MRHLISRYLAAAALITAACADRHAPLDVERVRQGVEQSLALQPKNIDPLLARQQAYYAQLAIELIAWEAEGLSADEIESRQQDLKRALLPEVAEPGELVAAEQDALAAELANEGSDDGTEVSP